MTLVRRQLGSYIYDLRLLALPAGETCPTDDAPLGFLTRGLAALGDAAVPLNLILLGNSLTSGPDWSALPARCAAAICVAKMVLMPLFGISISRLLDVTLGDDGAGWIALRDPCLQRRRSMACR